MLITLEDDGVVRVHKTVDDAVQRVEALDAEATFRALFDDTGEIYKIEWIRPNTEGRVLRFIVGNGEYSLVPAGGKDVRALINLLTDAEFVEPPEAREPLLRKLVSPST